MAYKPYVKVAGVWQKMTIDYTEVIGGPTVLSDLGEDSDSRHISDADIASFGGASVTKEHAQFYNANASATYGDVETTLILDSTRVNSDTGIFVLASNQVTVNKTGRFLVTLEVMISAQVNDRSEVGTWVEINGVEETASRTFTYVRGYGSGSTTTATMILDLTSGDVLQIRGIRTDDNTDDSSQRANGTRLIIIEI